jgi:hypothetical protein
MCESYDSPSRSGGFSWSGKGFGGIGPLWGTSEMGPGQYAPSEPTASFSCRAEQSISIDVVAENAE